MIIIDDEQKKKRGGIFDSGIGNQRMNFYNLWYRYAVLDIIVW